MRVTTKHVLYTVLDWGLGHATRSVPIIQGLIERGALVSLAGEGYSLELLKRQFPNLNTYPLRYPGRN